MGVVRGWLDRWGDGVVAVVLTVGGEHELWANTPASLVVHGGRGLLAVLVGLVTLPVAWRRRAPAAVLGVVVGAVGIAGLLANLNGLPVELFVALVLAFYSVGSHCDERRAVLAGGGALATLVTSGYARSLILGYHGPRPGAWLVFAAAWFVGGDLRRRRRQVSLLRGRASQLEREREEKARTAVLQERGRIARELHDVVAHSVSVMVVQAQAGTRLLDDREQTRGAFRSIEGSGREALAELRRMLGILRTADEQLAIGPQPGLASLTALVEQVREAGLPVELRIEGERHPLPPGVDLSAYRIVQEALTNALKHAGGAQAEIVVRYGPSAVELEIVDSGRGSPPRANGSGHGLIGMRERAALYGGTLEAGPREGGGFAVRAQLPIEGTRT